MRMGRLVVAVTIACWGTLISVWVLAAMCARSHARVAGRTDAGRARRIAVAGAVVIAASLVGAIIASRAAESSTTDLARWLQAVGLTVLVPSTVFALWARLTLGSAWSIDPRVPADRVLRMSGPYGVTRHPIYTGILGMVIGSALVIGVPAAILWAAASIVGVELKIRQEERLLLTAFPDEYRRYRERVPQLVPGLRRR